MKFIKFKFSQIERDISIKFWILTNPGITAIYIPSIVSLLLYQKYNSKRITHTLSSPILTTDRHIWKPNRCLRKRKLKSPCRTLKHHSGLIRGELENISILQRSDTHFEVSLGARWQLSMIGKSSPSSIRTKWWF